jgi:hypothetical protein
MLSGLYGRELGIGKCVGLTGSWQEKIADGGSSPLKFLHITDIAHLADGPTLHKFDYLIC